MALLSFVVLLLLLLACVVDAQPGDQLNKQCKKGQVAVQNSKRVPESNACSKPAGITIGGEEDFTYCCDRHDVCYESCNSDKEFCERDFSKCLQSLCRTAFSHNDGCPQAAQMYAMGTTMFGGNGFADSQRDFCECIDESEESVKAHYGKLVHSFYQKHASEKAAEWDPSDGSTKLDKYLAPYKGNGNSRQLQKIAHLHYALYKRYDKAIKHVGPRVGKSPPRPKKEEL